jgi:hypothetical protein
MENLTSNCCGASASYLNDELCGECLEHCEFTTDEIKKIQKFYDWLKKLGNIYLADNERMYNAFLKITETDGNN